MANWIDIAAQPWDQPLCGFPVAAGDRSCYEGCLWNFQVPNEDPELNTPRSSFHPRVPQSGEKQILLVFMKMITVSNAWY